MILNNFLSCYHLLNTPAFFKVLFFLETYYIPQILLLIGLLFWSLKSSVIVKNHYIQLSSSCMQATVFRLKREKNQPQTKKWRGRWEGRGQECFLLQIEHHPSTILFYLFQLYITSPFTKTVSWHFKSPFIFLVVSLIPIISFLSLKTCHSNSAVLLHMLLAFV